jgi:hypothetical protein
LDAVHVQQNGDEHRTAMMSVLRSDRLGQAMVL